MPSEERSIPQPAHADSPSGSRAQTVIRSDHPVHAKSRWVANLRSGPGNPNVERAGLQYQDVDYLDIAQLAVRDVDETDDVASQIEQRKHLHRRLARTKQRPRKDRQAQIDGFRVQRVSRVLQRDVEAVADIELARLYDQALSQFGVNAPVPCLVGISTLASASLF